MTRLLLAGVLVGLSAQAAPQLGGDLAVDAPVPTVAVGTQKTAAAAFGAGRWLVVWRDLSAPPPNGDAIKAALVQADGSAGDSFVISAEGGTLDNPAVAFAGTRFIVAWEAPAPNQSGIYAAWVDPASKAVTARTLLAASLTHQPAVASGGGLSLVAWAADGDVRIHGALLDDAGALVKSDFHLSPSPPPPNPIVDYGPVVARGPDNFLAGWMRSDNGFRQPKAVRVDAGGNPSTMFDIVDTGSEALNLTLTSDGTQYVGAWENLDDVSIYGRALPFDVDPPLPSYPLSFVGALFPFRPQLAAAGPDLLLMYEAFDTGPAASQIFGVRFAADGGRVAGDGEGVLLCTQPASTPLLLPSIEQGESGRTALASDGQRILGVWTRRGDALTNDDVLGILVTPSPTPSPLPAVAGAPVALGPNRQETRGAASNDALFLVVWSDTRSAFTSGADIYGMRFGLDGAPIDATPFVVCGATGNQLQPSVAALPGGDFLVAWADGRGSTLDIYAGRVGADGMVKDGSGFKVSQAPITTPGSDHAQLWPAVAAASDHWLVAWEDWRRTLGGPAQPLAGVWAATVSADGQVGTEAALADPVSDVSKTACAPAAAWNGTRFFVAYELPCGELRDIFISAPPLSDLAGIWVSAAGVPDATPIGIAALAGAELTPALASDRAGNLAVAWLDRTGGEFIRAGRLADNAAGLTGNAVTLKSGAGGRAGVAAAAVGQTFVFGWLETSPPGVEAVRTTADLMTQLEAPFPLSSATPPQVTPLDPSHTPPLTGLLLTQRPETTLPAVLAASAGGQVLAAWNVLETLGGADVARVHTRKLGVLPQATACTADNGCASGICTGGVCCDTSCDGVCQKCGLNGCVDTPASDARCGGPGGIVSCGALSTACRAFADLPLSHCAGFGQCGAPGSLDECTQFTDAPDGTACDGAACGGAGSCVAGVCVCAGEPMVSTTPRTQPVRGCDMGGGGGSGSGGWALLIVLALLFRRRWWALLLLAGCGDVPTALELSLKLSDSIYPAAATVRIVISPTDGTQLPATVAQTVTPGIAVSHQDYDGDGVVDIVVAIGPDYGLDKTQRLELVPGRLSAVTHVAVRAEVFDALHNRFARLGGASRAAGDDRVQALFTPGQKTSVPELAPACINLCPDPTLRLSAGTLDQQLLPPLGTIEAVAAGPLRGQPNAELVLGSPHDAAGAMPNAGKVVAYLGATTFAGQPDLTLAGDQPGGQLGAALAVGDLDGDGLGDLVISAPGADDTRGAVLVARGRASWPATLAPADLLRIPGGGGRFGAALAIADVDGDGGLDLLVGAPDASRVELFKGTTLEKLGEVEGAAGSGFGQSLDVLGEDVVIGAPLAVNNNQQPGAVAILRRSDLVSAAAPTQWIFGEGGGFGTRVLLASLDGVTPLAVVAAPDESQGVVFVLPLTAQTLGADTLRVKGAVGGLGTSLARLAWPGGDGLWLGAPSPLPANMAGAGAAFLVRGPTLLEARAVTLGADGQPAASAVNGDHAGDTFGSQLVLGDFDGDGFSDAAVGARGAHAIFVLRGPLL